MESSGRIFTLDLKAYTARDAFKRTHRALTEISTQVTPGAHAALLCDGAGWHQTGGRLRVPDNITLLPFPPYSPELNCMENVWHYLRVQGGDKAGHRIASVVLTRAVQNPSTV